MPSLAQRPCPVCGTLVDSGRCVSCQRGSDQQRGKTAERGYDAPYKRLRVSCFIRDSWRCVDCGWEPHIVTVSHRAGIALPSVPMLLYVLRQAFARGERHLHADHVIPIGDCPELRLVLDNLQTRCNVCHSAKTAREDGGFGNRAQWPGNAPKAGAIAEESTEKPQDAAS